MATLANKIKGMVSPMVGKLITYRKEEFTLDSFEIKDERLRLQVSNRASAWVINLVDAEGILSGFKMEEKSLEEGEPQPVPNFYQQQAPAQKQVETRPAARIPTATEPRIVNLPAASVIGSSGPALRDIIMDNIQKVQQDKDYIPQAAAVNEQVKSLIDLARAEADLYRAIKY